jgi:hypothetical protein
MDPKDKNKRGKCVTQIFNPLTYQRKEMNAAFVCVILSRFNVKMTPTEKTFQ